ncbi:MAG: hypothetical protein KJ676_01240 [Alphaproteobacteria bacterium]|nr:hypothetical protein [Alphaproteobacteria bacterium]MBU1527416.1 hypothetical protein [Alphaproteobacteria bacterium]MBU2117789.1 hypothetical protein [Alphaproteobacteria bacterium]MBU2350791.1 hypothetical protein [Alphaproteobacteria bacterium]MBU2381160.1 hypothetical protein [Alphaproteobacteria bacterium]
MTDPILPHTQPDPEQRGDGEVISETRAKGGRGGMHVLTILVVSATLVAIAFAVIYFVASPGLERAEERTEAASTSMEAAQPLPERPTTTLPTEVQPRTPDAPAGT